MAVTKLRADAPPFVSSCRLQFPTPPPPQCMAASYFHPAARSPCFHAVPSYPPVPTLAPPLRLMYGFHQAALRPARPFLAAVPCKGTAPFFRKVAATPRRKARAPVVGKVVTSPPVGTGSFFRKAEPSPPPTEEPVPVGPKDVSSSPVSRALLPHGSAPHKLCGRKRQEQARPVSDAGAAEPVKLGQEPAPAPAAGPRPRHGSRMALPRSLRRKQRATELGGGKVVGPRQAKASVERACRRAASSPSPAFTTRPPSRMPAPEWRNQLVTTVMIRNIPNKLKPGEMMQLLDEHCARVNRKKKPAAYDFLYLPMDFRKSSSNMGYAFVNMTTAEAARGLHYALHGARWKVHGTKKVIDICAARIQGKDALVSHFRGSTFPCHADEFLPAAFSPPRDGAPGTSAVGTYIGSRVHTPAPPQPPLPVAPAPRQCLGWRPVAVGGVAEAEASAPSS